MSDNPSIPQEMLDEVLSIRTQLSSAQLELSQFDLKLAGASRDFAARRLLIDQTLSTINSLLLSLEVALDLNQPVDAMVAPISQLRKLLSLAVSNRSYTYEELMKQIES